MSTPQEIQSKKLALLAEIARLHHLGRRPALTHDITRPCVSSNALTQIAESLAREGLLRIGSVAIPHAARRRTFEITQAGLAALAATKTPLEEVTHGTV